MKRLVLVIGLPVADLLLFLRADLLVIVHLRGRRECAGYILWRDARLSRACGQSTTASRQAILLFDCSLLSMRCVAPQYFAASTNSEMFPLFFVLQCRVCNMLVGTKQPSLPLERRCSAFAPTNCSGGCCHTRERRAIGPALASLLANTIQLP